MRILLTGIPGTGYHQVLDKLKRQLGRKLEVYRVGRDILNTAKAQGLSVTHERVLDTEESTLHALRSSVSQALLMKMAQSKAHSVIQTHASFRWRHTLRPAFDWALVKLLNPDVCVNLTDNWQDIWGWLQHEPQWKDQLTFSELLFWREEEYLLTKLMADELSRGFFLVPYDSAIEVLSDLMLHPGAAKVYLSHPMTGAKGGVRALANELKRHFVVFDPAALSDQEFGKIGATLSTRYGKIRAKVGKKEASFLDNVARGQIARIDFQFIDQTIITLAYYFRGSPTSAGVQSEMQYATGLNKDVYTLWLRKGSPSPFVKQYSAEFFEEKKKIVRYLRGKYATK